MTLGAVRRKPISPPVQGTDVFFLRTLCVSIILVSFLLLDLGLARMHYHVHLRELATHTEHAWQAMDACSLQTDCRLAVCNEKALELAQARQAGVEFVRTWHPVGRVMAEFFDAHRGMDQIEKIERLVQNKSCDEIIKSASKSNWRADLGSFGAAVAGCLGIWLARRLWPAEATTPAKTD